MSHGHLYTYTGAYEKEVGGSDNPPFLGTNFIHFRYKVLGTRSMQTKLFKKWHLKWPPSKKSFLRPWYKQTILPILDYSSFLLISLTKGQKNDLQTWQNDLQTWQNVKIADRVSRNDLHKDAKLLSLEKGREKQLNHTKNLKNKKEAVDSRFKIQDSRRFID